MACRHRIRLRQRCFDSTATPPRTTMSGAILALALALLVAPARSRGRLETLGVVAPARRRLPVWPCAGAAAAVLAVVLPAGLVAATALVGVTVWLRMRRRVRAERRTGESTALQGALD